MIELSADEVQVWHARLDEQLERLPALKTVLSADEKGRATRYSFPADRDHFVLARGILRSLLAGYTGLQAAEIEFVYSASGKPALKQPADSDLHFNLSHSHGVAVYAFTRGRRVGIDVECVRSMRDAEGIVERYFSPLEIADYRALPAEAREQGFFNGWVRKEAFVKALGTGLGHPFSEFSVSLAPGEPARFTNLPADQAGAGWCIAELEIDPGYVCALVANGGEFRVVRMDAVWSPGRDD